MWDTSSETPPISPQTARFMRRRSSAAHKALERDGSYYENLMLARNEADLEEAEKAFGWGGNAGAIRNASVRTHVRPFDLQEKARKHQCVGIEALIDPLDSTKRESGASEQAIETASSRKRWKLRLNICTSDSYFDDDCAPETGAPAVLAKSAIIVRQMEEARAARQAFLETRRARGSIMYDKVSGIAQIPLYTGPAIASLGGNTPALSSFAPRAPLSGKMAIAASTAAATVSSDGQVIAIRQEGAFRKGEGRYSSFLTKQ